MIRFHRGDLRRNRMAAVAIRRDIAADDLRRQARLERDGRVASRLLALAAVLDGVSREQAARIGGMDRQTCGTGFTALTKRVWKACATVPDRVGLACWPKSCSRSWQP